MPLRPPTTTRVQTLPFADLSWPQFEALCLRIAKDEATIEFSRPFGIQGNEQAGIDIYAQRRGAASYRVYQCKRVESLGPADIRRAVDEFLKGEFATKSEAFVLCSHKSLAASGKARQIEAQRAVLKSKGVEFIVWDSVELGIKLKGRRDLVVDFFGDAWANAFCGRSAGRLARYAIALIGSLTAAVLVSALWPKGIPISVSPESGRIEADGQLALRTLTLKNESDRDIEDVALRIEITPLVSAYEFTIEAEELGPTSVGRVETGNLQNNPLRAALGMSQIGDHSLLVVNLGQVARRETVKFQARVRPLPGGGPIGFSASVVPLSEVRTLIPVYRFFDSDADFHRARDEAADAGVRLYRVPPDAPNRGVERHYTLWPAKAVDGGRL